MKKKTKKKHYFVIYNIILSFEWNFEKKNKTLTLFSSKLYETTDIPYRNIFLKIKITALFKRQILLTKIIE